MSGKEKESNLKEPAEQWIFKVKLAIFVGSFEVGWDSQPFVFINLRIKLLLYRKTVVFSCNIEIVNTLANTTKNNCYAPMKLTTSHRRTIFYTTAPHVPLKTMKH